LNVIVFNEEARVEECLADARPHVDEIVVVDQMSTDRTPEIAQRLADVYIRDVHHGHAEPSRELAASRSSGDWLLILDADETMSDRLKHELRGMVQRDVDGYWLQKENTVDGVERSKIHHFRLVRKNRARFDPRPHGGAGAVTDNVETLDWTGIVHEKTVEEQIYDDARYERMPRPRPSATGSRTITSSGRSDSASRGRIWSSCCRRTPLASSSSGTSRPSWPDVRSSASITQSWLSSRPGKADSTTRRSLPRPGTTCHRCCRCSPGLCGPAA
jgi:hypothetical protein